MTEHFQHKDIERLLRMLRLRDLSEDEWSQLEAHAAHDPFLSDAIEGLRLLPRETRINHIQSILSRQSTASRKRKTVLGMSPWISIAASVLLLVGMFWLANRFMSTDYLNQVAENVTQDEERSHETNDSAAGLITESHFEIEPDDAEVQDDVAATRSVLAPSRVNSAKKETEDQGDDPPAISSSASVRNADSAPPEKAGNQTNDQSARVLAIPQSTSGNVAEYLSISAPEVKGIVMNYVGEPIGGAQIQIKGTTLQTQTDYLGNFALDIPNQNYRNALVISHEEYPPVEADVADGDSIVVRLRETLSDDKSDVVTLSQKRMSTANSQGSRALAQPVSGERSYNKYLRQNLRYPSQASKAGIRGSVIVEFDLSADGSPQNFRIVKSLGYGCDEEAIRLIREGPKWNVAGAQVPIGRWEVMFQ